MQEPKTLYGKYVLEREGKHILEMDDGYATFTLGEEICYIVDIFVDKSKRYTGLGSQMADEISEIAKDKGCKWLLGSVDPKANGSTESMRSLLIYGFEVSHLEPPLIFFKKSLEDKGDK
jgi:GNAT superfamily N-acetyltransferase